MAALGCCTVHPGGCLVSSQRCRVTWQEFILSIPGATQCQAWPEGSPRGSRESLKVHFLLQWPPAAMCIKGDVFRRWFTQNLSSLLHKFSASPTPPHFQWLSWESVPPIFFSFLLLSLSPSLPLSLPPFPSFLPSLLSFLFNFLLFTISP